MLVSAGNLTHFGRVLGAGEPITDPQNWAATLNIHLASGKILDVPPEVAEEMRKQQKQRDHRAIGQRIEKDFARAKHASAAAASRVQVLTAELELAEVALAEAEEREFALADKLQNLRAEYGDEALGFAPASEAPEEPESVEPPTSDEGPAEVAKLTAEQLRGKAIAAVGGLTKGELVKSLKKWWGIDLYELEDGEEKMFDVRDKKNVVVNAAVRIFEARFRLAEAAQETPSQEDLMKASLDALMADRARNKIEAQEEPGDK